jgi:homoserine kinase type II
MAVFTPVSHEAAREILLDYDLGEFVSLQGITAGIENTNYFLTTTEGEYVLTIFEVLTKEQIPFYLDLMYGLGMKRQAVPMPQKRKDGTIWGLFEDKPMSIVNRSACSGSSTYYSS